MIRNRGQGSIDVDCHRELEAIAKFSHPKYKACFVESYRWFENDQYIFIPMEYFPHGDLQNFLSSPLPEIQAQQIAFQLLEGLTILRMFSGTPSFVASEILAQSGLLDAESYGNAHEYTFAVDIWSLGEIIFRALGVEAPFSRGLTSYIKRRSRFPDHVLCANNVTRVGSDFVKGLLRPLPDERFTTDQALKHLWIASRALLSHRSPSKEKMDDAVEDQNTPNSKPRRRKQAKDQRHTSKARISTIIEPRILDTVENPDPAQRQANKIERYRVKVEPPSISLVENDNNLPLEKVENDAKAMSIIRAFTSASTLRCKDVTINVLGRFRIAWPEITPYQLSCVDRKDPEMPGSSNRETMIFEISINQGWPIQRLTVVKFSRMQGGTRS